MKQKNLKAENLDFETDKTVISRNTEIDGDLLAEEIIENMNSTPLGQVLKKIATLPEVRQEKVLSVRSQICDGSYDENDYLDSVLEKVLSDI